MLRPARTGHESSGQGEEQFVRQGETQTVETHPHPGCYFLAPTELQMEAVLRASWPPKQRSHESLIRTAAAASASIPAKKWQSGRAETVDTQEYHASFLQGQPHLYHMDRADGVKNQDDSAQNSMKLRCSKVNLQKFDVCRAQSSRSCV